MGRVLERLRWNEWNPGLDDEIAKLTLAEVLATMPAASAEDVPEIIQRYENPNSPYALPGAISLPRHDCVHCLLGRGLTVSDESFIIGVTMGAASDMTDAAAAEFIRVSTELYPEHWRFQEADINAYRLGLGYAADALPNKDIHLIPLETQPWLERSLKSIRAELGIIPEELRAYFRMEELLIPGTRSSRRLDTCARREDGAIQPAVGESI